MLKASPFFKAPRPAVYTPRDRQRDMELQAVRDKYQHNNNATRPFMGDPKYGFQTMLSGTKVPLPTAPAIVGGNVDWTQKAVGPATMFLHHEIMNKRRMLSPPMEGSGMFVKEPTQNSIHNTL
jgi:hypothetical protein